MMLTDTAVRRAKPKDKVYHLADGRGLHLEVRPHGARYWRFCYRFNRREKLLALGVYPDVTLKQGLPAAAVQDLHGKFIGHGNDTGLTPTTSDSIIR